MTAPKIVFLVLIVGPIIGIVGLTYAVWNQHRKIKTFQPTQATVVAKNIIKRRLGRDIRYEPMVRYQFEVEGQSYVSDTIATDKLQGSLEWAKRFVDQFPVDETVEAYYNTNNPSQALLLKEYSFSYYGGILFATVFLSIGIGISIILKSRRPGDLIPAMPGLYEIKPQTTVKSNIWTSFAVSLSWYCIGIAIVGHYFMVADPPYQTEAKVLTSIYGFLGVVPVGFMVYWLVVYWLSGAWRLGKTRVFVDQDKITLGKEINARAEQRIRLNSRIDKFGIGLVCEKAVYEGYERSIGGCKVLKCHDDQIVALQNYQAQSREMITGKGRFLIPSNARPSNPGSSSISPYCGWRIEMVTKFVKGRGYKTKFPIIVQR